MNKGINNDSIYLMDKPINQITKDEFDHKSIVDEIVNNIKSNKPPYNIALVGKWGTGKSSILDCVEEKLDSKEYLFVKINAWKYEKQEIRKAFILDILRELPKVKEKEGKIVTELKEALQQKYRIKAREEVARRNIWKILLDATLDIMYKICTSIWPIVAIFGAIIIVIDLIHIVSKTPISDYYGIRLDVGLAFILTILEKVHNIIKDAFTDKKEINIDVSEQVKDTNFYEEQMKRALEIYERKMQKESVKFKSIVCIVEDIDRLNADKMVEAISALKSFIGMDKLIFIVPYDTNILSSVLERCKNSKISSNYEILEGEMVLNKLFQYKIYMPELIQEDMYEYAKKLIENSSIPNLFENESILYDHILPILMYEEAKTPRDVKQLINSYISKYNIACSRVIVDRENKDELQLLALLTVLENDFNEFYSEIVNYPNIIEYFLENKRVPEIKETSENEELNHDEGLPTIYKRLKNHIYKGQKFKKLEAFLEYTENVNKDNIERLVYLNDSKIDKISGGIVAQKFRSALINRDLNKAKECLPNITRISEIISRELSYRDFYKKKNIILTIVRLYSELSGITDDERNNVRKAIEENITLLEEKDKYDLRMLDIIKLIKESSYNNCYNLLEVLKWQLGIWKPTYFYFEDEEGEIIENEKELLEEEIKELLEIYYNVNEDIQGKIKIVVDNIGYYKKTENDVQDSKEVYGFKDFFRYITPTLSAEEYRILGESFLQKALSLVQKEVLSINELQRIKEIYVENKDINSFVRILLDAIKDEDKKIVLEALIHIKTDIPSLNKEIKEIIFSLIEDNAKDISKLDSEEYGELDSILSLICVDIIKDDEDNSVDAVLKIVENNIFLTNTVTSLANNNNLEKIEQTIKQINDQLVEEDETYSKLFQKVCKKYTNEEKIDLLDKLLGKIKEYQGNINIIRSRFDVIKSSSNVKDICTNFVEKMTDYIITKYSNITDVKRREDILNFCSENTKYLTQESLIRFFKFLNNIVLENDPKTVIEISRKADFINLPDENWKETLDKYVTASNMEVLDFVDILEKKMGIVNTNSETKNAYVNKLISEFTDDERILSLLVELNIDNIDHIIGVYDKMTAYRQNNNVVKTLHIITETVEDKIRLVKGIINNSEDLELLINAINMYPASGLERGIVQVIDEYEKNDEDIDNNYRIRILEIAAKIDKSNKQIRAKFELLLIDVLNRLNENDIEEVIELMIAGKKKLDKDSKKTARDKLEVTISKIENSEEKAKFISMLEDFK